MNIGNNSTYIGKEEPKNYSKIIRPSYCCLVMTLRCSMKCKMCYIWKNNGRFNNELTIEEWKGLVNSLKGFLDFKHDIILSGGEPFLKKGVLELVNFSAKLGYKISIDTNAYLINRDLAKAIGDSGLWRVCISLDSLKEDIHDFLRGRKGTYYRVMKAIEYLHRFCPSVGINIQTVIMEQNLNELPRLAEWVERDKRLDYIYFQAAIRPFGAAVDDNWFVDLEHNFLWPKNIGKIKAVIYELMRMKDTNLKIVNTVPQFKAYLTYFENPVNFSKNMHCTIGNRDINIDPSGDAYLCFSKASIGNIRTHSIEQMWHSEAADKIRNEIDRCKQQCHFLLNCSFESKDFFKEPTM